MRMSLKREEGFIVSQMLNIYMNGMKSILERIASSKKLVKNNFKMMFIFNYRNVLNLFLIQQRRVKGFQEIMEANFVVFMKKIENLKKSFINIFIY